MITSFNLPDEFIKLTARGLQFIFTPLPIKICRAAEFMNFLETVWKLPIIQIKQEGYL